MSYQKKIFRFVIVVLFGISFTACEDQVYPELEKVESVLAVDAWINNLPETQVIMVARTQPYFDSSAPVGELGAQVYVDDYENTTYHFIEDDKRPGYYTYTPLTGQGFGKVGNKYKLTILTGGEVYEATTYMGRVPAIDSVVFFRQKRVANKDSLTRAEFWATDPPGPGDAYWIRSYKNGILLNKPNELNIAYDAGFSLGAATDGVTFIPPVRRGINPNDQNEDGTFVDPFVPGDSVYVRMYSISRAAFDYLNQVGIQTNRPGGFAELFSTPLANVSTNITTTNGSKAVGFFNVAAVSGSGKRYKR